MSFASKFNRNQRIFDVDVSGMHFEALADLYNNNGGKKIYVIKAAWINKKGKYGDQPTIVTPDFLVSCPSHMTETVTDMLKDQEAIDTIKAGKAGFRVYQYQANNRNCYGVEFVDL